MFSGLLLLRFISGSKKLSYPASFQGGLIYEAKVQALQKEEGATLYRIHYKVTF